MAEASLDEDGWRGGARGEVGGGAKYEVSGLPGSGALESETLPHVALTPGSVALLSAIPAGAL